MRCLENGEILSNIPKAITLWRQHSLSLKSTRESIPWNRVPVYTKLLISLHATPYQINLLKNDIMRKEMKLKEGLSCMRMCIIFSFSIDFMEGSTNLK